MTMELVDAYFTSYEDLDVHKLMLDDKPRNTAYREAIMSNSELFRNKIVMDIGAGSGILSVYCAQAGARKVYAVEASSMVEVAAEVVKDNHFEHVIEILHGKVENVMLKNDMKVDVIVSEWMGFYLLHEGMLESVLEARDRFLKPDGKMFPESAVIYVAPCSVPSLFQKWDNVDGVNMSSFARYLRGSKAEKPEIVDVKPEELLAEKQPLCWIDLKEEPRDEAKKYSTRQVVAATKTGFYQGICLWFECFFPSLTDDRVTLSTGPSDIPTHWKQTVIVLQNEVAVEVNEPIAFQMDVFKDPNIPRRYSLQVSLLDPEVEEHPVPCNCYMTKCIIVKTFLRDHPAQPIPIGECKAEVAAIVDTGSCLADEPIDDEPQVKTEVKTEVKQEVKTEPQN